MAVTIDDVKHIAELSQLKFSEDELINFTREMNNILKYVEKLNEINTENIQPLTHTIEVVNVFRQDEIKQSISKQEAFKNAPDNTEDFFRVPKIIKQ